MSWFAVLALTLASTILCATIAATSWALAAHDWPGWAHGLAAALIVLCVLALLALHVGAWCYHAMRVAVEPDFVMPCARRPPEVDPLLSDVQ